jgi:hypothetical protein
MNYFTFLENRNTKSHSISIPFIGKVWVNQMENGDMRAQPFFTESFSDMIKKLMNGDDTKIVKYFEEEFINPVLQEISES